MKTKSTPPPAVIDGIRLERWISYPHEDTKFRLVGALLPVRLMKDPLSCSILILSEIERRVNSHEALLEAAHRVIGYCKDAKTGDIPEFLTPLRNAIAQAEARP